MYENERVKREFFEYLKGAEGFAANSITEFSAAIAQWQRFTNDEPFGAFNKTRANEFRDWLAARPTKTKAGKLTLTSQFHYLRRVRRFFEWLSDRPGYKEKVRKDDVAFLRLSKNDTRIAIAGTTRAKPTLEDARKIIEHITGHTEVDRRDRALISFALITGGRIFAISSLKMKSFDKAQKEVDQNPGDGVRTKNAKRIRTTFFPIGWDAPERHFIDWYEYLEQRGFGPDDPIFPATATGFTPAQHRAQVQRLGWKGTGGARKIFVRRSSDAGVPYFNPHSFRHLVVSIMSEVPLTEREKRAISQNLGHENVGTTFGSYGCGKMSDDEAMGIVKKLRVSNENGESRGVFTEEDQADIERILTRYGRANRRSSESK